MLLGIIICRYFQIVHNYNLYRKNPYLLITVHFVKYLTPVIILAVQLAQGWAELVTIPGDFCDTDFSTIGTQVIDVAHGYALPILLNMLVYQFTVGESLWATVASLLNCVGISLDPIVVRALDVRVGKDEFPCGFRRNGCSKMFLRASLR